MFEKASRLKLRFETKRGTIGAEDLWDLPLLGNGGFNLDTIAVDLHNKISESGVISFVDQKKGDDLLQLRFDIVKHILGTKIVEAEKREKSALNKQKKEKILSFIAKKEDQKFEDMDIDALKKMAEEL